MAKGKRKPIKKKATIKKAAPKKKANKKPAIPAKKRTLTRSGAAAGANSVSKKRTRKKASGNIALEQPPNFNYSFTLKNARIDDLTIGATRFENPGKKNSVFADVQDTEVEITVNGTSIGGGASGSLSLLFEGNPVKFDPPADLKVQGGSLSFSQTVTLP